MGVHWFRLSVQDRECRRRRRWPPKKIGTMLLDNDNFVVSPEAKSAASAFIASFAREAVLV